VPESLAKPGRIVATKMLVTQSAAVIICTLLAWIFFSKSFALSALFGGLAALLPNIMFAVLAFRYAGASQIERVYQSMKTGSKIKLIFTVVIFLLIFRWSNVQAVPLLGTFVITTFSQWLFTVKNQTVLTTTTIKR